MLLVITFLKAGVTNNAESSRIKRLNPSLGSGSGNKIQKVLIYTWTTKPLLLKILQPNKFFKLRIYKDMDFLKDLCRGHIDSYFFPLSTLIIIMIVHFICRSLLTGLKDAFDTKK